MSEGVGGLNLALEEIRRRVWTPLCAPRSVLDELGTWLIGVRGRARARARARVRVRVRVRVRGAVLHGLH